MTRPKFAGDWLMRLSCIRHRLPPRRDFGKEFFLVNFVDQPDNAKERGAGTNCTKGREFINHKWTRINTNFQ